MKKTPSVSLFYKKKLPLWNYFIKKNSLFGADFMSILGIFYASLSLI